MQLNDAQREAIVDAFPNISYALLSKKIDVEIAGDGIDIVAGGEGISIKLKKPSMLMRAMMLIQEHLGEETYSISEKAAYENLGIMIDCSRNSVINFETYKKLIRCIAKMGYTVCQIYMENTYELEDYPYFGYQRGAYSTEELKRMDDYAYKFGIELIPAIQTLAHLHLVIKWPEMKKYSDTDNVLMVGDEKVYKLIESMISYFASCLRTKRINIGMDEAFDLGAGRRIRRFGYHKKGDIILPHLNRVSAICEKYGLSPMMWSDMFFRISSPTGRPNDTNFTVSDELKAKIPKNVTLAYADYKVIKSETYDAMMSKHLEMTDRVMHATGVWRWTGYHADNRLAMEVARKGHSSAVKNGIKEILVTLWGDNGAECSQFAVLPSLQTWAELCYTGEDDGVSVRKRFELCCEGDFDDFCIADKLAYSPNDEEVTEDTTTASRYLFFQDIMSGLFDAQGSYEGWSDYYYDCYKELDEAGKKYSDEWKYMFDSQKYVAKILSVKCRVGMDIRRAYADKDKVKLLEIETQVLPKLLCDVEAFGNVYRQQWFKESKASGIDVFDIRMGGLKKRIERAMKRIGQYLDGELDVLEELEEELLPFDESTQGKRTLVRKWVQMVSPRTI